MFLDLLTALQDPETAQQAIDYAAREAAAHGLESFVGGATLIVEGSALVVILIILIIL